MRYATQRSRGFFRVNLPYMSLRFMLFCVAILVLMPGLALAQNGTLSGTITDGETGDPLPGANVFIVELAIGAAADVDGNYTISGIASGAYTVRVSFIGFKANEQAYSVSGSTSRLDIVHLCHSWTAAKQPESDRDMAPDLLSPGHHDSGSTIGT